LLNNYFRFKYALKGDTENARHENVAQICKGVKMQDWKMWYKEKYGTPYVK